MALRPAARCASFLLACLFLATPAQAGEPSEAGARIAASLLEQLEAVKPAPSPAVKAVAVKPFGETGSAKGTGQAALLSEAVAAALQGSGKVSVRDWSAVEKVRKEKAKTGAAGLPVQALVAGDVLGGDAGAPPTVQVRLFSVTTGETLASASVTLGGASTRRRWCWARSPRPAIAT